MYEPLAVLEREGRVPPDADDDLKRRYERERVEYAEDRAAWRIHENAQAQVQARSVFLEPVFTCSAAEMLSGGRVRLRFPAGLAVRFADTIGWPANVPEEPVSLAQGVEVTGPRTRFVAALRPRDEQPRGEIST